MMKLRNRLFAVSLAAAAVTLLGLPAVAAQTEPASHQTKAAKTHPKRHAVVMYQPQYQPPGCTWPYTNQFPPCMSTWPGGSPSYHGPVPGVTFDNQQ
jgi:hypothetical protein